MLDIKIGNYVYDEDLSTYGIVKDIPDVHNILVEYEEDDLLFGGGSGLYCIDPSCEDYDPSLKLIKRNI